jgi:hypothetical protein
MRSIPIPSLALIVAIGSCGGSHSATSTTGGADGGGGVDSAVHPGIDSGAGSGDEAGTASAEDSGNDAGPVDGDVSRPDGGSASDGSHGIGPTGQWINVTPADMAVPSGACGDGVYGVNSVVADSTTAGTVYSQANCQGIWKSTDYAQTWSGPINTGVGGQLVTGSTGWMTANQDGTLYFGAIRAGGAGGGGITGIAKSTDQGVSWTEIDSGIDISNGTWPPTVDPYNPLHLLATTHEKDWLWQSFDGGNSWSQVTLPGTIASGQGCLANLGCVHFVNTGVAGTTAATWLYQTGGGNTNPGVWRTTNSGGSWTSVDNGFFQEHGLFGFYQPDTSGVVYITGWSYGSPPPGVHRSADYGLTWTPVGIARTEQDVFGSPNGVYADFGWACNCSTGPSWESAPVPGTGTWTKLTTPASMAIGSSDEATLYDGTNYIFVTANYAAGLWRYAEP